MGDGDPRNGIWIGVLILIGLALIGFWFSPSPHMIIDKEDPMMQQARSINLLMFCYANDNSGAYPTGKSSTEVFQKLIDDNYCSDPEVFYYSMPGKTKPTSHKLKPENVCFDITVPVFRDDTDWMPIVFSTGYKMIYAPGGSAIPLKPSNKTPGISVAYKDNSARFIKDDDQSDQIVPHVINQAFNSKGKTFQQLTPDGPLTP